MIPGSPPGRRKGPAGSVEDTDLTVIAEVWSIIGNYPPHLPADVLETLQTAFAQDKERTEACRTEEREKLQRRLTAIRNRMDQAYLDKLDGRISEDFWKRKSEAWQQEEQQVLVALNGMQEATAPDRMLTIQRILELANKAHFLYVRQKPAEQAKLLKMVLSNCAVDRSSLYPAYRKPFELIFKAAKNENWLGGRDSNPDRRIQSPQSYR